MKAPILDHLIRISANGQDLKDMEDLDFEGAIRVFERKKKRLVL